MSFAETIAQSYNDEALDPDALRLRFGLEIIAHGGDGGRSEEDLETAWAKMDELLVGYSMVQLWLDGVVTAAFHQDTSELAFQLSDLGKAVAERLFGLDDTAGE